MARPKVVSEIMTQNPIVLREEDDLWSAQEDMQNLGYHHAPVVDDGKLVGLVSHEDLLRAATSSLHPDRIHADMDKRDRHGTFIAAVMRREVDTVRPETPIREAARAVQASDTACVVVTDADGTVRGLLTSRDFMGLVVELLPE